MSDSISAESKLLTADSYTRPTFQIRSSSSSKRWQAVVVTALIFCSLVSLLTTIGIIVTLALESWGFFADDRIEIWKFLTGTKWN
jgi:phosphate transport system permease protein